jgi:hypothetical protein
MGLFDLPWLASHNDIFFARIVFESSLDEKGELALTNERLRNLQEPFLKKLGANQKIQNQAKDNTPAATAAASWQDLEWPKDGFLPGE